MTDTSPVTKTPRWIKVLLVISLGLNLLIAGAVGASMFWSHAGFRGQGPHGGLARPGAMQHAGHHLMWKLPRERRRELLTLIRKHRRAMQTELNTLADKRLALAKLLASPSPDKAAIDKALATVREAETALHKKSADLFGAFIKDLSPHERQLYAKILQTPPRKHWFGRHH